MTRSEVERILTNISYKEGWRLRWHFESGFLGLFWVFTRPDVHTGESDIGYSGLTYIMLGDYLTEEGLIRYAFRNALQCEEHECREFFRYGDQRPFNPHRDLIESEATKVTKVTTT